VQQYYDISVKRNGRLATASGTPAHHSVTCCTQLLSDVIGLALRALLHVSKVCAAAVLDNANSVYRGLTTLQAICGYESE